MATPEALYTGNGATTTYAYAFDVLDQAHVKASLDGVDTTAFSIPIAGQVQFNTAPTNGAAIRIYRRTPDDSIDATFTPGSAIRSQDLNSNFEQLLFVTQEDRVTSDNADTKADLAITTAEGAVVTADAAETKADAAVVTADAADAKADTAIADSAAAVITAGSAEAIAISAAADADAAVIDAAAAVIDAAASVVAANNAESIANSALDIVAGTIQYIPIADVASIPGTPDDGDAIQVVDSTGIEGFTPLAGLPGGFTGSAQLFVRLQYTTAGATWNYVGYGANDPDNRYVIQGELGTATSPAYYFDTNTGIYSPGADQVAISTNGTGRLFVKSNGDLENTGTPNWNFAALALRRNSSNASNPKLISFMLDGDTINNTSLTAYGNIWGTFDSAPTTGSTFSGLNGILNLGGPNALAFHTNSSERLRITSDGKLGLGTSVPPALFTAHSTDTSANFFIGEFQSTANPTGLSNTYVKFEKGDGFGGAVGGFIEQGVGSGLKLSALNGGTLTDVVTIRHTGNVGIGVASPSSKLTVGGNPPIGGAIAAVGSAAGIALALSDNTNSSLYVRTASGGAIIGTDAGGTLRFATSGNDTANEKARIDNSGRLLVGTSTAYGTAFTQIQGSSGNATDPGSVFLRRGYTSTEIANFLGTELGLIDFGSKDGGVGARISSASDGTWSSTSDCPSRLVFSTTADGASSPTERMRISSNGTIFFGQITNPATSTVVLNVPTGTGNGVNAQITSNTGTSYPWSNYNASGTYVGGISCTSTATSFPTSSDYRLKQNVQPLTNAATLVAQLKPSTFEFKEDVGTQVQGFIAHEVQEVVPLAVVGEKDAVDANGNPIYQGVDASKLVPLLTAALQEALVEIESLKARVTALEP